MIEDGIGPEPTGEELLALLHALPDGWREALGVRFVRASRAELTIDHRHLQPLGVVHGGVYAGLVETVASVGAGGNTVREKRPRRPRGRHLVPARRPRGYAARDRPTALPGTPFARLESERRTASRESP